jgi:OFA family oxalate/formate antiporter-like MFS transporter
MGGQMMIAFARPIAFSRGYEMEIAARAVIALSLAQSFGRLLWGLVSDKIGRKNTIIVLLSANAVLSLLVNAAGGMWVFVLVAVFGFFYGGLLSTFPSLTADIFGPKHMATNYGFVLLGFGIGAILSSQIAGKFTNIAQYEYFCEDTAEYVTRIDISRMYPAFIIASCCAVAGIVMMIILKTLRKKNKGGI